MMEMELEEDVDDFLQKIETKYSHFDLALSEDDTQKQLHILSGEFETLGLPLIDVNQSNKTKLIHQIVCNTFLLIQLHRKDLSQIANMSITRNYIDTKKHDLEKIISHLKAKNEMMDTHNKQLENKLNKLNDEYSDLKKIVNMHNEETNKIKHYYKSKQNELTHQINSLKNENTRLKEICGQDVDKYFSKEDKFLKVIKKYKQNEEVYKRSLQKLEENNAEIMNEILNLKEELALVYSDKGNVLSSH